MNDRGAYPTRGVRIFLTYQLVNVKQQQIVVTRRVYKYNITLSGRPFPLEIRQKLARLRPMSVTAAGHRNGVGIHIGTTHTRTHPKRCFPSRRLNGLLLFIIFCIIIYNIF